MICGFFSCDARPFNPPLDSLPRFMRFSRDGLQGPHNLLDHFIRFATALKSDEFSSVFLRRLRFGDGRRPIAL